MKKMISLPRMTLAMLAFGLLSTTATAQIDVVSDGDVGIGTSTPSAKLHVLKDNDLSSYTAYFSNTDPSNSTKYGLYNYVGSAGTGYRLGLYNVIYGYNSTSTVYGLYNYSSGGTGSYYGMVNSNSSSSSSASSHFGLYNSSSIYAGSTGYGFYNNTYIPSSNTTTKYGIYNYVSNSGTGTVYGLYSSATGSGNYAGYFNGDVHVNGNLTWTSDERKKSNISSVSNALSLISQLDAKTYNFVDEENMGYPTGEQYGFLAQDLEKVLPNLVQTIHNPKNIGTGEPQSISEEDRANGKTDMPSEATGGELEELKSVNYVALIPILVQAVKEQQKEIEALREELRNK